MELLKAENLKKYYGSGHRQVRALDGVDLSIEEGEIVAIVGTSGRIPEEIRCPGTEV